MRTTRVPTWIESWRAEVKVRKGQGLIDYVHRTLAALDGYTDGHTHRVAQYSVLTAARLDDAAELTYLTFALHDIGKLLIPTELICKPAALTPEEYRTVQQHPELGAALIVDIPQLQPAMDVVVAHHERWDGQGYPNRLRGTTIPLSARILAVADTFDAMTTDRPYRKGRSSEEAIREIVRFAGTQFDPRVVDAFLQVSPGIYRAA